MEFYFESWEVGMFEKSQGKQFSLTFYHMIANVLKAQGKQIICSHCHQQSQEIVSTSI